MSRNVTDSMIRAIAARAFSDAGAGRVVAVRAPAQWNGPDTLDTGAGPVEIRTCVSSLAIREQLAHLDGESGSPKRLILLTEVPDEELGSEVTARLWRNAVVKPSGWEAVKELFRVSDLDPALADARWLVDLLVEVAPSSRSYPTPPSGYLDYDTAWREFLRHGLGITEARPVARDLLRWGELEGTRVALKGSVSQVLKEVAEGLARSAGPVAHHVVRLAAEGRGGDLVPLGLICDLLWSSDLEEGSALTTARVRFEGPVGAKGLSAGAAGDWGHAAVDLVHRAARFGEDERLQRWLGQAEVILNSALDAAGLAVGSDVLPRAFEQRLKRAGQALSEALERAADDSMESLQEAVGHAARHLRASDGDGKARVERLEMAERLVRRLQIEASNPASDLADAASSFVEDGAWVDRAREAVSHGETTQSLSEAYGTLLEQIDERREERDRSFAEALAAWSAVKPSGADGLLPIERVLDDVIVPLARETPLLMLVLDGWSHPEAMRIEEDLRREGWLGHRPAGRDRPVVVSALPSVTAVSRTSLLSGRLCVGTQADERRHWKEHEGLREVSRKSEAPLFHRRDLATTEGRIAPRVRDAIVDPDVRVVGVVVNALDEHLDKGGQLRLAAGLEGVRPLRPLLDAATESGRAVVLVSDHGHVLEAGSRVALHGGAGERWRPNHPPADEGEIEISGPRVLRDKGSIVVPSTERLRYMSAEKRGYHGGATPQEVLCPLLVLSLPGHEVTGWEEWATVRPEWWQARRARGLVDDAVVDVEREGFKLTEPVQGPPSVDPDGQVQMFADDGETVTEAPENPSWLEALLASPMLEAQREAAGRQALSTDDLSSLLRFLDEAGGVMRTQRLAEVESLPHSRVRTKLAALGRMLNVDGYSVVSTDSDGTVRFDRALLIRQFRLDP